jgi:uncharacterized protein (DUF2141 family)
VRKWAPSINTEQQRIMSQQKLASWLLAGGILLASSAQAARVTVTIEGIHSSDGVVMAGLFDSASAFPQKFLEGRSTAAKAPSVTLIFENVQPGRYAISAFHDLNNNGRLDTGAFGIPKEPYGFSRDARGVMGPPAFDEAAFDVPVEGISLVIHVK